MLLDVLIDSPVVRAVPVSDNAEPLVDAPVQHLVHPKVSNDDVSRFLVRAGVAERLVSAAGSLARFGADLALVEGYRDVLVQTRFWDRRMATLTDRFPSWTDEQRRVEAAKFVAPPTGLPPHSTGGAVDVVLLDGDGVEIGLGWPLNTVGVSMATDAVTSGDAGRWRSRLVGAMESVGFVNYPQEWWHFSYGDQYWAWRTGASVAVYGSVSVAGGATNSM